MLRELDPAPAGTMPRPALPSVLIGPAVGAAVPGTVVGDHEVAARIGVPEGWIPQRTGVQERRHAGPGETLSALAEQAARAALAAGGHLPESLDLVLVATVTADDLLPNAAPELAGRLGADHAGALDVGAACNGFLSALELAAGAIQAGRARLVLVVGADVLSRHTDHSCRRTAGLFADGAGAVVVQAGPPALPGQPRGLGPGVLRVAWRREPLIRAVRGDAIRMDGLETYRTAVASLERAARAALDRAGWSLDDVDLVVPHQANARITSALAARLGLEPDRVVDCIGRMGNTSAASLPLALAHAQEAGRLQEGARVLLAAFGAGCAYGATTLVWGRA